MGSLLTQMISFSFNMIKSFVVFLRVILLVRAKCVYGGNTSVL